MWHDGLICKSKQNEMKDKLLCLLTDFLKNCKQRVGLNGQFLSWIKVNVSVPHGQILWPLLFLIYVNDLPNDLQSNPKLFDDYILVSTVQYHDKHCQPKQWSYKNPWRSSTMGNEFYSWS